MKVKFVLVVNERGGVRTLKTPKSMAWDEIAINLCLEIPDKIFRKPLIHADIKVPEDALGELEITADMESNIIEAITKHTGVECKLTLVKPEEEE